MNDKFTLVRVEKKVLNLLAALAEADKRSNPGQIDWLVSQELERRGIVTIPIIGTISENGIKLHENIVADNSETK